MPYFSHLKVWLPSQKISYNKATASENIYLQHFQDKHFTVNMIVWRYAISSASRTCVHSGCLSLTGSWPWQPQCVLIFMLSCFPSHSWSSLVLLNLVGRYFIAQSFHLSRMTWLYNVRFLGAGNIGLAALITSRPSDMVRLHKYLFHDCVCRPQSQPVPSSLVVAVSTGWKKHLGVTSTCGNNRRVHLNVP